MNILVVAGFILNNAIGVKAAELEGIIQYVARLKDFSGTYRLFLGVGITNRWRYLDKVSF